MVPAAVAVSPGGPTHVLLSDDVAEHIAGCNMAFRRDVLLRLGGFDPVFRAAGDDVDICWRFQDAGYTIGFSPAAMVWHFRRNTVEGLYRPAERLRQGRGAGLFQASLPLQPVRPGEMARAHLRRSFGRAAAVAPAVDLFRRFRPRACSRRSTSRSSSLAALPAADLRMERGGDLAGADRDRRRRLDVAPDRAAPRHLGDVHQRRAPGAHRQTLPRRQGARADRAADLCSVRSCAAGSGSNGASRR